jgi:tetratricopeptide (TPR) repeat protein
MERTLMKTGLKSRWIVISAALTLTGCTALGSSAPPQSNLFSLSNQAELAYTSGQTAKAEELYKALVRSAPNNYEAWFRLGNLYARSDHPDAAADAYQRALTLNGTDPRAWHNLGVVRLRQGWAALIASHGYLKEKDPLYRETGDLIHYLSKMPILGEQAAAYKTSDADDVRKKPQQPGK